LEMDQRLTRTLISVAFSLRPFNGLQVMRLGPGPMRHTKNQPERAELY
jgi:hypothetical protein